MSQFRDLLKLRELKHPEKPQSKDSGSARGDRAPKNKESLGSSIYKSFKPPHQDLFADPLKKTHRRGLSIGGLTCYDNKREQMSPSPILSMYLEINSVIITRSSFRRTNNRDGRTQYH